ncbi:MAG: hypothetical protein ABEH81_01400 [Halopenitus sp.]
MELEELKRNVGEWSEDNFGDQTPLAPAMGFAEEFAELVEAESCGTHEEVKDSIGDMAVYLCDYAYRTDLDLSHVNLKRVSAVSDGGRYEQIILNYGALCRSALKTYQGIRLDEDRVGPEAEKRALDVIFRQLVGIAFRNDTTFEECIDHAWELEVKHRSW